MKRLFVGISIEGEAAEHAIRVQDLLREVATRQGVRFVRPDKIHLTLKFIGDVDEARITELSECMADWDSGLSLTVGGLIGFPDLRRPKVIAIDVSDENGQLVRLHAELCNRLSVTADDFRPHLTLARVSPGSPAVGRSALTLNDNPIVSTKTDWHPTSFALYESTPAGDYVSIREWRIGELNKG